MHKSLYILPIVFSLLAGCAAYKLDEAQHSLRSSFAKRNFSGSVELLHSYQDQGIYKKKDQVLYLLEMGTALHFSENYDSSSVCFTRAEEEIDQQFTKSISRGLTSMLLNDNALVYDGEDYEDIYLNAFKSLNFIQSQELDAALVEARRMAYKLSRLEVKYEGVAEAMSSADTLNKVKWKAGKSSVQNSALSRFLSSVLYAKSGKPDDARIEYEKLREALTEQPTAYSLTGDLYRELNIIRDPYGYNVLLVGFAGRAPVKRQHDIRTFSNDLDSYVKFSIPSIHLYPSVVRNVQAVVGDTLQIALPMLEEMDRVAREIYKVKQPIIYGRAFLRAVLKAGAAEALEKKAEKKNDGNGGLAKIFGILGQELTEKADLRGWQTMPGKAYANVVKLPPGEHAITIEYRSEHDRLLFSETKNVVVQSPNDLKLAEALYWN